MGNHQGQGLLIAWCAKGRSAKLNVGLVIVWPLAILLLLGEMHLLCILMGFITVIIHFNSFLRADPHFELTGVFIFHLNNWYSGMNYLPFYLFYPARPVERRHEVQSVHFSTHYHRLISWVSFSHIMWLVQGAATVRLFLITAQVCHLVCVCILLTTYHAC